MAATKPSQNSPVVGKVPAEKEDVTMAAEKLERYELFALLNERELARLSGASAVVKSEEGERLYYEGLPASHLFILLKGRVELRRPTKGGPSLLVDDLLPKAIFGVSSLVGTDRYLLNAECVEDSEVLRIEGVVLRQILEENPVVAYTIQKRVSQIFFKRYVDAMERLETIMQAMPLGRT
jgi:CRP-like cAMP-binding protein